MAVTLPLLPTDKTFLGPTLNNYVSESESTESLQDTKASVVEVEDLKKVAPEPSETHRYTKWNQNAHLRFGMNCQMRFQRDDEPDASEEV